jgi:hypothetical protein
MLDARQRETLARVEETARRVAERFPDDHEVPQAVGLFLVDALGESPLREAA